MRWRSTKRIFVEGDKPEVAVKNGRWLWMVTRRARQNLKTGSRLRGIVSTRAVGSGSRGAIIG